MQKDCKRTTNPAAAEKLLHFPPHLYLQVLIFNWVVLYLKALLDLCVPELENSLIQSLMMFIQHRCKCSLKTFVSLMQSHRTRNRTQTKNLGMEMIPVPCSQKVFAAFFFFNRSLKNIKSKVIWHSTEYDHVLFPFPSCLPLSEILRQRQVMTLLSNQS